MVCADLRSPRLFWGFTFWVFWGFVVFDSVMMMMMGFFPMWVDCSMDGLIWL